MWILPSRPNHGLSPAVNHAAPTAHAVNKFVFQPGHKPPGFAGCLLLPVA